MTEVLPKDALAQLPTKLREELVASLQKIISNFRERRWEPSELNGGKLCEVIYSILRGHVDGSYPAASYKPSNMVDDARALEKADSAKFPRSVRIQIPRMLIALYEIRNNRGVGHVGGDVDPNLMDAVAVMAMAKWLVAELVRMFHDVDTDQASAIVDALVERELPLIWEVGDKKRLLSTKLTMREKTLLLLYGHPDGLHEKTLVDWLEHSNATVYRRDILAKCHQAKLIEYDKTTKIARISPLGVDFVESKGLVATPAG
jgi:hypothetical protein